ncbi:MAG: GNAT family N-acetyltransferase [Chlorobi bacterium]|nr:MAG: Acetyltransferase (GNAT) family protein [Chlorobi bacterium OLB7]MBK8910787.1 GNAT family N-acetyltransferase [Chlorobiota bacterium]MBX7216055.1 GNAT family N-acetyltransferase [Candidatus Kapabacteria bacterium]
MPTFPRYQIRRATATDASGCAAVNRESWHTTYRGLIDDAALQSMDPAVLQERWRNRLSPANSALFCFVATLQPDGDPAGDSAAAPLIVGYVMGGLSRHSDLPFSGELLAIYLLAEHQGKGLGRKLFLQCVQEFRQRAIDSFVLFVLKENHSARAFYSSFNPDFEDQGQVTIDGFTYQDIGYGWNDLRQFPTH